MNRIIAISIVATLAAPFSGCDFITGVLDRQVGYVAWELPNDEAGASLVAPASGLGLRPQHVPVADVAGDPWLLPVLEVPDTVHAGQSFTVLVRTYGSDTCWQQSGADISRNGMLITIVPYDERKGGNSALCPMAPVRLPRELNASFPEGGTATVRVRGYGLRLDGSRETDTTLEKTVIVKPKTDA